MGQTLREFTSEDIMAASSAAWADFGNIQLQSGVYSLKDHEYQQDWFDCDARVQCFKKGAQIGATEIQVLKTIHGQIHGRYPQGAIYLFPTQFDVTDFSKARFKPLIESNMEQIGKYVIETDASNIKRIGTSMLYLRGARSTKNIGGIKKSSSKLKSVPADRLVVDEVDEMEPSMINLAEERLSHSTIKEEILLGTPSIPDYGIDKYYQRSDQRIRYIRCEKCNGETCLDLEFPNCIERRKDGTGMRVCKKCGNEIFLQNAYWASQYPDADTVGWWISQLYSVFVDPIHIVDLFENPPDGDLSEIYNSKLGLAYIPTENRLTQNDVFLCCSTSPQEIRHSGPCAMGVDVGKELNVVIGERTHSKAAKIVKVARVSSFNDVAELAKKYNVMSTVFDLYPETRKVRDYRGSTTTSVFGCAYNEHQKGQASWDGTNGVVTVNRTEICDATHDLYAVEGRMVLPRKDEEIKEYAKQMCNIAKVLDEDPDTGSKKYIYRKLGADHYRHATNYFFLALQKIKVKTSIPHDIKPSGYV